MSIKRLSFAVLFSLTLFLVFFLNEPTAIASSHIRLAVNGREINTDVPLQVIQGRTMVPVRFVAEALGADVKWDAVSRTVVVNKGNAEIELVIGGMAYRNGQPQVLDVPAQIMKGRTLVPVRFVSEALGCRVRWDEASGTVNIFSNRTPSPGLQPQREEIFSWETGDGWGKSSGDGSAVEDDVINYRSGRQSLKLKAVTSECWADKIQPANLLNKYLVLDVYVYDVTKLRSIGLVMGTGLNWESYFGYSVSASALKNGWNSITLVPSAFYRLGAVPPAYSGLAGIKRWRIKVEAVEGHEAAVSFDRLQAVSNVLERGLVTITFDDGFASVYAEAKLRMDKYGFPGVAYVITDLVGAPGRMSIQQLKDLQAAGWDIASHTKTHAYLVGDKPDADQIRGELEGSKRWLAVYGFQRGAQHFSSPGGEFNSKILDEIKKHFVSHRTIMEEKESYPPADPYMLKARNIINTTPVAHVQKWVDEAAANKEWLILIFHNVNEPADIETKIAPQTFQAIIDYIAAADVDVVTMSDVINQTSP